MAAAVEFELVTPEKLETAARAHMVVVPGAEGDFGVMAGHVPMISLLRPGVLEIYEDAGAPSQRIFVTGGFSEVTGERCTVLAEHTIDPVTITADLAFNKLSEAKRHLESADNDSERKKAEKEMAIAQAMAEAAGK